MTPEINEFLKKVSTAKGITAILIVFFLVVFIWKNLDFLTEVSFTFKKAETAATQKSDKEKKNSGVPQLAFGEILVPPSPSKLPSFLVFEIKNPGSDITNDVRVNIDLGVAQIIGYEIIGPKPDDVQSSAPSKQILNVVIKQLGPHENLYIYIQSSSPAFKRASLSSSNTIGVKDLTLNDYIESKEDASAPSFEGFLLFILGGFLLVMSGYFTLVLISKLNKWLKMDW